MQIEPDHGTGIEDYVVVEDGTHPLRIDSIRVTNNADGEIAWMLRLALVEGERAGRIAAIDWLNFNERGFHRVRSVLSALGWDVSVPIEVETQDLEGKIGHVRLVSQESTNTGSGRIQRRSRVPYDGGSPCPYAARYEVPHGAEPDSSHPGSGWWSGVGLAADAMPF